MRRPPRINLLSLRTSRCNPRRLRSREEWETHPQGQAVATLPLFEITQIGPSDPVPLAKADRPLEGVKVLDLTL